MKTTIPELEPPYTDPEALRVARTTRCPGSRGAIPREQEAAQQRP